ncbi:MAG: 3-dehydroquinate synthase [Alphaproteobacteria bacterium MarineAlpha5_Bin11]|nr:MAG: 3-dehydroquinate synthase [Alphaproteobacteria bacterium MarineAlpha5_Bin11]
MSKKINIKTKSQNYKIVIGTNILKRLNKLIDLNDNILNIIIIDSNVWKFHKKYINKALNFNNLKIINIKSSENKKSLKSFNELIEKILKLKPTRQTKIIIVGGGVLCDLGGFVASTILRGLSLTLVPTTLLAQADSAIGGKNGINSIYGKNFVGTFYQPELVLIDPIFLNSLSKRELKSGYSEIVKHALIRNKVYFYWLKKNFKKIIKLKRPYISEAIFKSVKIKSNFVIADEREMLKNSNSRALLNFGHTVGHALESINNYNKNLNHGEAISAGMIIESRISAKIGLLSNKNLKDIEDHFKDAGLKTKFNNLNHNRLMKYIVRDKKNNNNMIKFIALIDIGKSKISKNFTTEDFKNLL